MIGCKGRSAAHSQSASKSFCNSESKQLCSLVGWGLQHFKHTNRDSIMSEI